MGKLLQFGLDAREKLQKGVDILANAVAATMGPKGRNVVLGRIYGPPAITKDGVSVAREIDLTDDFENQGAQLVKEVAQKTADDAGDGTTTATVLARAIYTEGLKLVAASHDPMSIKRGIDKATKKVVNYLQEVSREVSTKEEIIQVGAISANNETEIGQIIAEAMERVGEDGVITVEEQFKGTETTLDVVEGMQFDRGWITPYFVTNADTMTAEYKNVYILLHEKPITHLKHLIPFLQKISQQGQAKGEMIPLLVIADSVEAEALAALVLNKQQGTFPSVAVRAPSMGPKRKEILLDLAAVTGATLFSAESGKLLQNAEVTDLGIAKSIVVTRESTTIVAGGGTQEKIDERISQIKHELQTCEDYDQEYLKQRLAKLASGVAVINVGGNTEVEINERKDRVEDALNATKAAVAEGIVPGGGVALLRASKTIEVSCSDEEQHGVKILLKALQEPIKTIARNAGKSAEVVSEKVQNMERDYGYNAATDNYENLVEAGVIDPTKVVRSALENAASIAGLMLTTEVLVVEEPHEEKENTGE